MMGDFEQQCQLLIQQAQLDEVKISSQKTLLVKAKQTIDNLRSQIIEKTSLLSQEIDKTTKLEGIVATFLGNDEQTNKDQEQVIGNVINQYEERMKRIVLQRKISQQDQYEKNEKQLSDIQVKQKTQSKRHEEFKQGLCQQLKEVITFSEDIRESSFQYLGDFEDESYKTECQNKIKLLLLSMQRIQFEDDFSFFYQLKNHLLVLHQSIFDVNKKISCYLQEQQSQDILHNDQLGHLEKDLQKEKREKLQHIENGRKNIKQLELQIEQLNIEQSKKNKDHEQRVESQQKEMLRNVNVQYIKNIMISFFCNEQSVQQKTIPVIATVLQFTEAELQQVKQAWDYQQKTSLGKFFSLKQKRSEGLDSPK